MAEVRMLGGHKEWAPTRKIDPRYDMDRMRARVAARLAGDDVTPEDIKAIAEAVWAKKFTGTAVPEAGKNVTVTARQAVENTRRWAHMGAVYSDAARRLLADPDALAAAIAEELGGTADSATVQAAVRKVLGSLDEEQP